MDIPGVPELRRNGKTESRPCKNLNLKLRASLAKTCKISIFFDFLSCVAKFFLSREFSREFHLAKTCKISILFPKFYRVLRNFFSLENFPVSSSFSRGSTSQLVLEAMGCYWGCPGRGPLIRKLLQKLKFKL